MQQADEATQQRWAQVLPKPQKKFVIIKADQFKKKELKQLSKLAARHEYISTGSENLFIFL